MMKSSTRSPNIAMVRFRSDRLISGANIPTMFHRKFNGGDKSYEKHVTEISSTSITPSAEVAFPYPNKSDYIYLTQSTDSCSLIIRFPLDDFNADRAFVSHITELMRTTNSVTMKCDFNTYLSNVSISRNLPLDECTTILSHDRQNSMNEQKIEHVSSPCSRHGSYTKFDDLLAMIANEKTLLQRTVQESQGSRLRPRMRLCGGGEDSLNNGTSAWGTPPTSANSTSAWGMANQQPPQQAWGGTPGNGINANSSSSNINNNQIPATNQSQRQSSQSQDQNANKAPAQQQGQNNVGSGTPNAWNRNPTQPTGHNPNVANNNLQLQQQQQQQQPPQQQQIALANNGNIAAKSQLEQLSNMREALFSQDGWGCQNVNQDTNWEVPGSPEPGKPETNAPPGGAGGGNGPNASASGWKPCNTNNGTELWEANLRNGGAPQAPQPVQKAPWGPASNIGGTWGEDDDSGEANVWNGGASANPQAAAPPAWGQNNPAMWPPGNPAGPNPNTVKKENEWGGVGVIGGNSGANPAVPPAVSGWDGRGGAAPSVNIPGPIGQNTPLDATRDIRGDPRGISGRLNGNVGMWDQPNAPNLPAAAKIAQGPLSTVAGGSGNQWNAPIPNKLPGAWDDASPALNTRPSLDDGPTALWNQGPLSRQNSNASNWKDMSDNVSRNSISRNPAGNMLIGGPMARGMRLGGMNPGIKPDNNMWGQNQGIPLNGSWGDDGGWEDKGLGAAGGPWNDFGQNSLWNKGKQGGSGWPDPGDMIGGGGGGSGADWNMNKPQNKLSQADFIRNSKQFRMLCENGFKKEDVECALRNTNMNFDESLDILQRHCAATGLGDWRRPDDHSASGFDTPFSNRFPSGHGSGMPFSQQNLLNNLPGVGGTNPNLAALNNIKYLSQGPVTGGHSSYSQGPNPLTAAANASNPQNAAQAQPSTQQLRMLVQQIQMAVHAGFLNHQILNQPLAPTTLLLLNQLLSQIRQMQHIQNNLARSGGATGVSTVQLTMQINKHKAQISQLQQQIAAQQAIYVKQQQQPQQQQQHQPAGPHQPPGTPGGMNPGLGGAADYLRQQDLVSLQSNFADMALGKDPVTSSGGFPTSAAAAAAAVAAVNNSAGGAAVNAGIATGAAGITSQQSRLNQWKLPSLEKESGAGGANDLTDFSRAPGTTGKSTLSTASSNMGSLGLQDGTWSSGRSHMADGWPDQTSSGSDPDNKDWNSPQDNAAFSDLVPEFEPGKPWKGAQMKIDEDPSITPGSVARSPLSIATAKEADLFGTSGKPSPTDSMGLASSTWGFNAAHQTGGKLAGNAAKKTWPDAIASSTPASSSSDLWGAPVGKTTRGPPPGLGANKNVSAAANGWPDSSGVQRSGSGGNWPGGVGWGSSWLLLKNLTSQIDVATLRTLCMQHGPLQNLQLYANHGLALIKYSSREEANKAQLALNNCPLGTSTIGAECPSDSEVQAYLQQLGTQAGNITSSAMVAPPNSSGGVTSVAQSWRQAPRTGGADTWGSGWPPTSTGTTSMFWAPIEGATERSTPSNLNSFLPESLLGSELN